MEKTRIFLGVNDTEARDRYLRELAPLEVDCKVFASLLDLHASLITEPCNGILIDFPTKIKATPTEKNLLHAPLQFFPVMLLRWDKKADSVWALAQYLTQEVTSLAEFITKVCPTFQPRAIRASSRRELQFNILLRHPLQAEPIRTVTQNISEGGCFIITPEMFKEDKTCLLQIIELDKERWIEGTIRWRAPWGTAMRFPGLGVMFESQEWISVQMKALLEP